jgi:Cof subfamily protein (haloacid dehalogenase superfamily)
MKSNKLIVSDFDGTLKHSGDYISTKNLYALAEFHKRGGQFVIATARPLYGIRHYLKSLPFLDFIILCNGGWIWDIRACKTIYKRPISRQLIRFFAERYWDKKNFNFMMAGPEKTYINYWSGSKEMEDYQRMLKSKCISTGDLTGEIPEIFNIEVSAPRAKLLQMRRAFNCEFGESVASGFSWTNFMEIYSGNTSKGTAMKFIAKKLGIRPNQVLAFGDGDNDIELFEESGTAVAMANATRTLKSKADFVTSHYNDDGIADYLEKFVLNGG